MVYNDDIHFITVQLPSISVYSTAQKLSILAGFLVAVHFFTKRILQYSTINLLLFLILLIRFMIITN